MISGTVRLEPAMLSRDSHRISRLPAWIGTEGRYWHVPRSAQIFDDGRVSATVWCGQIKRVGAGAETALQPPDEKLCGTCVGRHLGSTQTDNLIFAPQGIFAPPAACPGNDKNLEGGCTICGIRVSWSRGPYASGTGRHRPGPDLAEWYSPCYRHGWTRMYEVYNDPGVLVCSDFRCEHRSARV